jgi:hypothetical protein
MIMGLNRQFQENGSQAGPPLKLCVTRLTQFTLRYFTVHIVTGIIWRKRGLTTEKMNSQTIYKHKILQ